MRIKIILFTLLLLILLSSAANDPFALPQKPPLKNINIPIQYAYSTQIAAQINSQKKIFLSSQGHIIADKRTNSLWIEDKESYIKKIQHYIASIDTPAKQILIKARIIMMDSHSLHELGTYFSAASVAEDNGVHQLFTVPLLNFNQQKLLNITLVALEQQGHINIVATPALITSNRQTAAIESGEEIPYQERSGQGNTSTTFKKAVLQLRVTPTLLPNGKILLNLRVSQNKPSSLFIQGVPSITTQRLKTHVVISNKQTLILGGISQKTKTTTSNGLPFLDKIPIIKYIFRHSQQNNRERCLMIFITPTIL